MTILRWLFVILCGPSFIAIFFSIMRETTLLDILGFDQVGTIVALHKGDTPTPHFALPRGVSNSPLCQHWCEQGHTYTSHDNEKHLWAWLRPHCSCAGGESGLTYDLDAMTFVLVGGGSLIEAWEGALKEAGAKKISLLSCTDLASSEKKASTTRNTVYLFETCLPENHELLDLKPQVQRFAASVHAVFSLTDHVVEVGKKVRAVDDKAKLLWLVPKHFKSCVYTEEESKNIVTRSRGYELAMLRQYLMQRHVLLIHNIYSVDTQRLLFDKRDQGLRSHLGTSSGHLVAYLHRLFSGNFLRDFVTLSGAGSAEERDSMRLAEKCTTIMHSRAYDDLCMPRPHQLLPVLVTGLGGSATHSISDALVASGADMPHESIGSQGSVCWMYAVNDVLAGTQYPHHARLSPNERHLLSPRFQHIVHVIRPTMDHISTFTVHHKETYAFVYHAVMVLLGTGLHHDEQDSTGRGTNKRDTAIKVVNAHGSDASPAIIKTKEQGQLRLRTAYRRTSLGGGCQRGHICNLYFAATTWLYWNRHVSNVLRYTRSTNTNSGLEGETRRFVIGGSEEKGGIQGVVKYVCSLLRKNDESACSELDSTLSVAETFHRTHGKFALQDVEGEEGALAKESALMERLYDL